ncbi:PBSX family phage terminase large subunit [Streptomyces sp. NPDC005077]|uniref:PBSX family phage terminase large subunit n=1 Tax=Streptomyces sp. NPDC005077 TaxID=3154292 RepID=UPI00339DE65B
MDLKPLTAKQRLGVQLSRQHEITIYEGSVRSAKTITSLIDWMDFVRNGPPGNLLMAGKTTRTLRQNVIDVLVEMLGTELCSYNEGKGVLTLMGRRIIIASGNDESSKDKIRGLSLVGAYVDELSTMPESFFSMLTSRMSDANPRLIGTSNPDSSNHWLKKKYLDKARVHLTRTGEVLRPGNDLDLARLTFVIDNNPTLTPTYVQQRKAEYSATPLLYRRLILGEWCIAEGAVYEVFDEQRHVVDIVPDIVQWLGVGLDYGTSNATAALLVGIGSDGCIYVTNEWRHDGHTEGQISDGLTSLGLRKWLKTLTVPGHREKGVDPPTLILDPSAASFHTQLREDGMETIPAHHKVLSGIRLVANLLAADKLRIHRGCTWLLGEMASYVWDPKASLLGEDKPLKQDDHSVDALRYAIKTTQHTWREHIALNFEEVA